MPPLDLLLSAADRRDRFDRSGPELFAAPGHAVADLIADRTPVGVIAGVYNIADRRYRDWGSIASQPASSVTPIGFFTAPRRNYALTLETRG